MNEPLPILPNSLRQFAMHFTIVCMLIFAMILGSECIRCPSHCYCSISESLVKTDCVRINLVNTFAGISHRTQILDLSYNFISILHGNEFVDANLRLLQDLRLSNNRLNTIDKFSFNGLHFLENLDLSSNSIEYLNPITFKYNPLLKTLNLTLNPLSVKRNEPFLSPAPSLQTLDLTECHIEFVDLQTFSDLMSIVVLNISQNRIRNLNFLEGIQTLKYLVVSKNEFPCSDDTIAIRRSLIKRKIQFRDFCQTSERMQMFPELETKEMVLNLGPDQEEDYNVTERVPQRRSLLYDISNFLKAIPSFYAIVCGIQLGIFIGAFSTYVCLKKSNKRLNARHEEENTRETSIYTSVVNDNSTFALIPHGTPPSPYHSRFFPSSFSLSAT